MKPNDGRVDRRGKNYACQQLRCVSLFDFTTQPEAKVLGEAIKWQQFLGDVGPITVLLGFEKKKLPGRLIPYPENKKGTTGPVIPWVEVCHHGPIPASAIVSHILVCGADYFRFRKFENLDEEAIARTEAEFGASKTVNASDEVATENETIIAKHQ